MSKKIKVGIIGLGRAGAGMHTQEIAVNSKMFEIVAACDCDEERAKKYAEEHKCKCYTNYKDLLKDKNVELVAVATFSLDHVKHAGEALKAGYSVIIEKPLAVNYATALKLKKLDKAYPGKLYCRQNRRFESAFHHVREIIATGILGDVRIIKLRRNSFSRRNDWQTLKSNGGGQLNNWGPHLIDHALQFLDYKVESVWGDLKQVACMGDVEDCVKILMKGKNGITVDIEIYDGAALPSNTYEIYGTRGALSVDNFEQDIKMRYIDPSYKLKPFPVNTGHPNGFNFADNAKLPWIRKTIMVAPADKCNMNCFYKAIYEDMREGKPFPVTVDQAVEVVRICEEIKKMNPEFL